MHWISSYIGRTDLNCWGLLRTVYRDQFQLHLPEIAGIALAPVSTICSVLDRFSREEWILVKVPFEGCAVAMSQSRILHHVGIFIAEDGGKVAHTWGEPAVVVADTLRALRFRGFRLVQFYQHRLWPTS